MMDRNREARRAAAMANGLPRRRHRTTTSGSLRESPEDEGQLELQETAARLRDRTVKKDRDREMRDRDRDHRERERDRLSRTKRRRGDNYREDGGVGGGDDDSSEESVNDEDEEDDDGRVRYVPPSNHVPMSSLTPASTLTSHRKSYPPPSKVFRVAPTWKAPDEMIGVSIPRKARSATTKRGHDCWSSVGGVTGEVSRQPSTSPVRSQTVAGGGGVSVPSPSPSPSPAPPISPSSSNVSIKKKIKVNNNGLKQRPPKPSSKSSPSIQDEIEIEVAEVLYGLKRQSQAPPKQQQDGLPNDSTKVDSRSTADSKFRVSSPLLQSPVINHHTPPLTTVAPKRKRPRPYPEEIQGPGPRSSPIPSSAKAETDQATKMEAASPTVEKSLGLSGGENGGEIVNLPDITVDNNGVLSDVKEGLVEESGGIRSGKVEEASSSPKMESPQNNDRVESSTTSTKPNSALGEPGNHREEKFEIDLMAPPQTSPEREEEMAEYRGGDEKTMLTDKETEGQAIIKPKEEDDDNKGVKSNKGGDVVELNTKKIVEDKQLKCEVSNSKLNLNASNIDLEKSSVNVNEEDKLIFQKQQPKTTRDDASTDNMPGGGQSGTAPLPMSVPGGWHGGIAPMGYVGPLQGVVSMDGTPMASPPIQSPHFLFSQPKPKRCATHCYIARSISVHQQMLKMNPFWPAAAGTAPLFNGKPYNLNMVPPPTDLHTTGRGVVVNPSQDNNNKQGQPFTFFSGQPTPSSKDKSPQAPSLPDSAQKQFLLQPALPPGAPSNILHAPALFFPMGQQQSAVPNVRPGSTKSQSTSGATASTSAPTSAPMGTASNAGPAMSFSYPSMAGNETQFMAILGNSAYPFPIPAHVGAASPYRGTHPQAMPFFNGSFYSSQMLHPSQLQQQQQQAAQTSQSAQLQPHNQPNSSLSTTSSSSQKHLQSQQMRPQGSTTTPASANSTQGGLQNFQASKGRTSQSHHDIGGEGSPSTADGRTRQNMSVYGQNFAMPFNSPNFALMTSGGGGGGGGNNATGVSNGNLGDKKQQQPQQNPAFPMSFATINGTTTPGLDMSSIAQNHAIIMSLPEAARQNYQIMAAQAAQHKKNSYRSPEDGKTGGSGSVTDTSNVDEERKAMAMRASAGSVGQSIAFSRDLSDNSTSGMPGNTVVDSSARSMNLVHGSYTRPSRSPGQNSVSTSNASNPSQQMLFPKQQQYVAPPSASSGRTKTSSTNGNVYPDHLGSPSIMAAKFPNSLSGFPPLVQTSVAPAQSSQWKNSVRPNASQVSSPSMATSTTSTMKNLPQQPGRSQQNHTQISFGPTGTTTPKASSTPQGQQTQNNNQSPSPMMVGSPSTSSVSKGASGSPRTTTSASTGNKPGGQGSTLASQQGKSSQSPSLSSQKQSILGSPHHIMSTSSNSGVKPQIQQSQLQAQFSKQNLQQAQLYFSSFMQPPSATTSAAMAMAYPQRHRPDTTPQGGPGSGSKSQGPAGPITSSSGMLSLCNQVSGVNTTTSDPAKVANNMKGSLNSQGVLQAAAQFAAQSAGGAHQLMPAGFPYVHAVSNAVQVKSAEQKQPTGE